ncbi:MAG: 30S ribosomal protein S8 [Dehalococcoidia bacterium]|nr:ribosomal protein S8 [Dehalococcoidia bacterium]MBF8303644.1 ribosomal protein [Dehalococcoidia bacterium]MDO8636796.1 30S ribosomal protein S8 [Dehalococcoidia bacterium]
MVNDPISDMLTRLRNAIMVGHDVVLVPVSRMKIAISRILKQEGFISDYEVLRGKPQRMIRLHVKYFGKKEAALNGLKRVSRPGLRIYVQKGEIPRVYGGLGVAILSTSKGIMTGQQAWKRHVGGELLCFIW